MGDTDERGEVGEMSETGETGERTGEQVYRPAPHCRGDRRVSG